MVAEELRLLMKGCLEESKSDDCCREKAADERLLTRISVNMAADGRLL